MTDSATKGMLDALTIRSNARRAAYGLDAVTVPDPDGIFEYVEMVGIHSGERNILRVKLRKGDEIIPMTKVMRTLKASEVEVRYWLRQDLLTALDQTQQWHDGRGMYSRHPEAWDNIDKHFFSLYQVTQKVASLPRLLSYEQVRVREVWKKYKCSEKRQMQMLEARRMNIECQVKPQPLNPICPDGKPLAFDQAIHKECYFLPKEIKEIEKLYFTEDTDKKENLLETFIYEATHDPDNPEKPKRPIGTKKEIVKAFNDQHLAHKVHSDEASIFERAWKAKAHPEWQKSGRRIHPQKLSQ